MSYPAQQHMYAQPQGVVIQPSQLQPLKQAEEKHDPSNEYYYPGTQGQDFAYITPSPDKVEEEPQHDEYNGIMPDPVEIEQGLLSERPTAPSLLYNPTKSSGTYAMPIKNLEINSELHVATGFIRMKIVFVNTSNKKVNGLFVLPTTGTVTSCEASLGDSMYLDTTFVSNDDAKQFEKKNKKKKTKKDEENTAIDMFIPDVFRLPIKNIQKNEIITIQIDYMEELIYTQGRYHFNIPLEFGNGVLPPNIPISDIINIKCSINCLTPGMQYGSTSHQLILTENENLRSKLTAILLPQYLSSINFHLAYRVQTNMITGALINSAPHEYAYDPQGSFVCFINPPAQIDAVFPRDIIFLLDRSGSMSGEPMKNAQIGLKSALSTLNEQDRFCVVAYDHEQTYFIGSSNNGETMGMNVNDSISPPLNPLVNATQYNKQMAEQFIGRNGARGGTDIKTPLLWALKELNNAVRYDPSRIPFVVLLTDGAVYDEKEIVKEAQAQALSARILTFGIGKHCNYYFLQMLANLTRGWNDGCIYSEDMVKKMKAMMDRASIPILTNLELKIPGKEEVEMYPKTIPDLFAGGPITISGKYSGMFPEQVEIVGRLGNGSMLSLPIRTDVSEVIPVNRVFLKQRIDQLTAEFWLTEDKKIKKQIVDVSINERFPSPYTSMVAYEITPEEKRKRDEEEKQDGPKSKKSVSKGKGKGISAGAVAALAGGAIVIGAGIFLLGNAGATMANVSSTIGGGVTQLFSGGIGGGNCACDGLCEVASCGNIDCGDCANILSCGNCGDCDQCVDILPCESCNTCGEIPGCDACGGICDSIEGVCEPITNGCGNICGNACGSLCGICESCTDGIGNICEPITNGCGNICDTACGSICGVCGTLGDGICDTCGGAIEGCAECFGGGCAAITDGCGGLCGNLCGVCGNAGDLCDGICGACGNIGDLCGNVGDLCGGFGELCEGLLGSCGDIFGCFGEICEAIAG